MKNSIFDLFKQLFWNNYFGTTILEQLFWNNYCEKREINWSYFFGGVCL